MNKAIFSLLQSNKKEDIIASMCLLNESYSKGEINDREMQDLAAKVFYRLGGIHCFARLFNLSTFPKVQYESLKFFISCCQFNLIASIDESLLQLLIQLLLTNNDQSIMDLRIMSIKSIVHLNTTPNDVIHILLSHPALSTSPNPFAVLSLLTDLLSQSIDNNSPSLALSSVEAVALQTVIIQSLHGAVKEEYRDVSLDHLSTLLIMSNTLHPAWTIATAAIIEGKSNNKLSLFPVFTLSLMSVEVRLSCEELLEIIKHTLPTTPDSIDNTGTTAEVLETRLCRMASVLPDCLAIISSCLQLLLEDDDYDTDAGPLWQSLPAQDLLAINRSLRDIISSFLDFTRSVSQLQSQPLLPSSYSLLTQTVKAALLHIITIITKLILEDFEICQQVFNQDHFICLWQVSMMIWLSGHDTEIDIIEAIVNLTLTIVETLKDEEMVAAMIPKELPVIISERLVDCMEFVVKAFNHCLALTHTHSIKTNNEQLLTTLTHASTIAIFIFSLKKNDLRLLARGEGQIGAIASIFGQSAMQACEQTMKIPPFSPLPIAAAEHEQQGQFAELEMEVHMLFMEFVHMIQELQDIHLRSAGNTTSAK